MDSGINFLKNKTIGIILLKDVCPLCGKPLNIITRWSNGFNQNIKYKCSVCEFECPIYHDGDNINPTYDKTIQNFIKDFGEE